MSSRKRETVWSIVTDCLDELEINNYGLLALAIEKQTEKYLDEHYPKDSDHD